MKLNDLAKAVDGNLIGDGAIEISRARGIEDATRGDISFLHSKDKNFKTLLAELPTRDVSALVVADDFTPPENFRAALIKAKNPQVAFVKISQLLAPKIPLPAIGVHPSAIVDETAKLGKNVKIGARVVISANAQIGDNVAIFAGAIIGENVSIGANTIIFANVVIYYNCVIGARCLIHSGAVIGADGFGYQWDGEKHLKVPQIGNVIVGDDVELGANSTIDRARFGTTVIGDGTKIDNLVHIAHNCQIGKHCIFAGLVGVSGSVEIGNNVVAGGQSGFADHLKIGDGVKVFAKSGVMNDMPAGVICGGLPAQEYREGIREYHNIRQAGKKFKELEKRVTELEQNNGEKS